MSLGTTEYDQARSAGRPLRIGELAARVGVNPKTIRYYEDIGLLPAPRRTSTGYRLYDEHDRERLSFIRRAKQMGFSLDEIKGVLDVSESGQAPCGRVLMLLDRKIDGTAERIHALTAYYRRLVELRGAALHLTREQLRAMADRDVCICGIIEIIGDERGLGGGAPPSPLAADAGALLCERS